MVSSMRILDVEQGDVIVIAGNGGNGVRNFISSTFSGTIHIPRVDVVENVPAGLRASMAGASLNNAVESIDSWPR